MKEVSAMKNIIKRSLSAVACAFMIGTAAVMPVNAAGEEVSLTSVHGKAGETVTVNVDVACNNNFESLDIVVTWEDKALKAAQAKAAGKAMAASDAGEGYCTVVVYGSEALADGAVATIDFTIPSDAPEGKTYDIKISTVNTFAVFEGPDIYSTVKVNNGTITVGEGGGAAVNNSGENNNNNNNDAQAVIENTTAASSETTAAAASSTELAATSETTETATEALTTEKKKDKTDKKKSADALGALVIAEMIAGGILVYFGLGIAFGFLTRNMNEKKGYTGGFLWGFLLSIIGVVIVAVRKPKNVVSESTEQSTVSDDKGNDTEEKK